MPYKRKTNARKYKKRGARTGAKVTGPPRMTRALRVHQNLTRDCRYFKTVYRISSNTSGNFSVVFAPSEINNCKDFKNWGVCWEEYKILSFKVKLQPISVGSESLTAPVPGLPGIEQPIFKRGLTLTWLDQGDPDPSFGNVEDIIVRPSCKTVSPRYVHYRWATRPNGNPEWGKLAADGTIQETDSWTDTRIRLWGQDYTPIQLQGQQTFFFATVIYKVLFRGRQQFNTPTVQAINIASN